MTVKVEQATMSRGRGYSRQQLTISLPKRVVKIIDELIKKGDYKCRSDFITEATRSHLNTWYSETWEGKEKEAEK